jgi:VPDSG-CTERM motif
LAPLLLNSVQIVDNLIYKKLKNMKTKNKWLKVAGSAAAVLAVAASVHADPIVGSVGFTGTYTQNGGSQGDLATATSFTIDSVSIENPTGVFTGASDPTFYSPITVNPANNLLDESLWTVQIGGVTYSLLVGSETETFVSGVQLDLSGTGTFENTTAADDTAGTWQLQFGVSGASFTWDATSATNVPDGGTTVILLGAALSGLALVKRKLAA